MNIYTNVKQKHNTAFCHSIVNKNQDTTHAIQRQKTVQGVPKKRHKDYGTIILQPYVTESSSFSAKCLKFFFT